MDIDADVLVNPFSSVLGILSLIGFFILARRELALFLTGWLKIRPAERLYRIEARKPVLAVERRGLVPGLVLMGLMFSAVVMLIYNRTISEMDSDLVYFLLVMLPGAVAGTAASLWIDPGENTRRGSLLGRVLLGIVVYLALFTIAEFSEFDVVLLLFGPLVMMGAYWLSPVETH